MVFDHVAATGYCKHESLHSHAYVAEYTFLGNRRVQSRLKLLQILLDNNHGFIIDPRAVISRP